MIKLEKAATKIMAVIGTAVMLFLLFYSWKYTKRLLEPEYYLDEKDSIFGNLLISVILLVLGSALYKVLQKIPEKILHLLAILTALAAAVFGICLAYGARTVALSDQYYVQRAAEALATGDVEWTCSQEYYRLFPFQLAFAQIYALLFRIAGSTELIVLQYVQAVFGGITLYVGFRIVRELSGQRLAELIYLLAEITFLPAYCYALFIYGEMIGVCSAVCAIWCFLVVNRPGGKCWKKCILWCMIGLLMTLSYVARSVLLVVWIAMFIMQLLLVLRDRRWKGMVGLCVVLAMMCAGQNLLCSMAEGRIGRDYGSGAPYILWITMGTQDNEDPLKGSGTYNGYNVNTYMQYNYNKQEAAEAAEKDLGERLAEWSKDPREAADFLKEKLLIQWNEPTYGGFVLTRYLIEPEKWVDELYFGQANVKALQFLNRYQAVLYLAILGYYLRILFGKLSGIKILPGIIFLGGFFITLLWEAKSRYVYPYIVMILPCAACSMEYYSILMQNGIKKIRGKIVEDTRREK